MSFRPCRWPLLFFVLWAFLFGVSVPECTKFFLYAFVYHGLNGFLILSLLRQNFPEPLKLPAMLLSGMGFNSLTLWILSLGHLQKFSFLNIFVLVFLAFALRIRPLTFAPRSRWAFGQDLVTMLGCLLVVLCGCAWMLNPIPDVHTFFQAAIAHNVGTWAYPYVSPCLPEIPVCYYNYGYHLDMAFCSSVTHIPLYALCGKLYPYYVLFMLAFSLCSYCQSHCAGKVVAGWLAIASSLCVVHPFSWSLPLFLFAISGGTIALGSTGVALSIFFLLADRLDNFLNSKKFSVYDYVFIAFLFVFGSVARSAFAPVVLGGTSFLVVVRFWKTLQFSSVRRLVNLNILFGSFFLAILVYIYGMLSPFSAINFIRFVPQTSITVDFISILPSWFKVLCPAFLLNYPLLSHSVMSLLHLLFIGGFLTIGLWYQVTRWIKVSISDTEILLVSCALTGWLIYNFTESPGLTHTTFYQYTICICSVFAANGTILLFKKYFVYKKIAVLLVCVFGILAYLKIREVQSGLQAVAFENSSLFRKHQYTSLLTRDIEVIKALCRNHRDVIILNLLDDFSINSMFPGVPVYKDHFIGWGVVHIPKALPRVTELGLTLCVEGLDDKVISQFRVHFPHKNIIVLSRPSITFTATDVTLLTTMDDLRIFMIPAK